MNAQIIVEDDERHRHRLDDSRRVVPRPLRYATARLSTFDVDERQDGAFDPVIGRLVRRISSGASGLPDPGLRLLRRV